MAGMDSSAHAGIIIGGITYVECGTVEWLNASFTTPEGGTSTRTYTDLVEIQVSGSGQSFQTRTNDAFWIFTDMEGNAYTPFLDPGDDSYQLALDTSPITGAYAAPTPSAQHASTKICFDIDANTEVFNRPYIPAYRTDHEYHFVADIGTSSASLLHFGVADGIYWDNSGSYTIGITQLTSIPEPAPYILLGSGAIASILFFRRLVGIRFVGKDQDRRLLRVY